MATSSSSKDKFFEKVINPYLSEVMKHPHTIEMHKGVLHIRDVQGRRPGFQQWSTRSSSANGMAECGLCANHSMITNFIPKNQLDTRNMG
ncbi:40S ribosomal protein S5-1 [Hordeum vulgare]|nr:40S ribosomal protein S5-1 [Hordeum vulgare]